MDTVANKNKNLNKVANKNKNVDKQANKKNMLDKANKKILMDLMDEIWKVSKNLYNLHKQKAQAELHLRVLTSTVNLEPRGHLRPQHLKKHPKKQ